MPLKYTTQNTASGQNGVQRKERNGQDKREILRILHDMILVSKIQPKAWNDSRTILIHKQGKDRSRVENYGPLTIGSLICHTYWGIVDRKLREVASFSPRQKGFVNEPHWTRSHIFTDEIVTFRILFIPREYSLAIALIIHIQRYIYTSSRVHGGRVAQNIAGAVPGSESHREKRSGRAG